MLAAFFRTGEEAAVLALHAHDSLCSINLNDILLLWNFNSAAYALQKIFLFL